MLPGSVADVTTLSEAVGRLKAKGMGGRALIDRGFESASNVKMLLDSGLDFVTPSNADTKVMKKVLTDGYPVVKDPRNYGLVDGNGYGHTTLTLYIVFRNGADESDGYMYATEGPESAPRFSAHVIYDLSAELDSNEKLLLDLLEMKTEIDGLTPAAASKKLSKSRLSSSIALSKGEDGRAVAEINWNAVSFRCNRAGVYILLTREGVSWEDAVAGYALRNEVEEAFDAYKNDLDGKRNRTSDPDRARGRFFIRYLSLMMIVRIRRGLREYSEHLPKRMRKDDKVHRLTTRGVIRSLNSLIAVGSPGSWRLTFVTKQNRQIFSAFGLGEIRTSRLMERTELSFKATRWDEKDGDGVSCKK